MTMQITFVPAWAAKVVQARGVAFKDSFAALSEYDKKHFLLANHLFVTKLQQMGIARSDFTNIADGWKEQYSESDALFALFGANKSAQTVSGWKPSLFDIHTDPSVGYTVVETPSAGEGCLLDSFLQQLDLNKGRKTCLSSSAFRILLEHHVASLAI